MLMDPQRGKKKGIYLFSWGQSRMQWGNIYSSWRSNTKHRKVAQCVDSCDKAWLKGTAMRLKAQGICGHFNLGQENIKPFSTSASWRRFPKGNTVWKTQSRQSRQILQLLLHHVSELYKRRYYERAGFRSPKTGFFDKDAPKWTYVVIGWCVTRDSQASWYIFIAARFTI